MCVIRPVKVKPQCSKKGVCPPYGKAMKRYLGWQSCNIQHWMKEAQIALGWKPCVTVKPSPLLKKKKIIIYIYKKNVRILQASSSLHQKDAKLNLEVGAFVDIKILWWIHNRSIVYNKIFVIKLISNWWRGWSVNEIKPHGNIEWRKPYGSVRRKDLYGKFLLNEIPN